MKRLSLFMFALFCMTIQSIAQSKSLRKEMSPNAYRRIASPVDNYLSKKKGTKGSTHPTSKVSKRAGENDLQPVTIPEGLVVEDYTLRAWHYRYNEEWKKFSKGQYIDNDEAINIKVGFDGRDVYIQGFFDRFIPDAWVKGTLSEDETTITFQTQYYGTDGNGYDHYLFGYIGEQNSSGNLLSGDVVFQYDKATSTFRLSPSTEVADSNSGDTWMSWDFYDFIVITKGYQEQESLVVPPEGIHLEDYSFSASVVTYDNNNNYVETPTTFGVKVGFDGDDVYIKGICQLMPEAWVKGSLANGKLTIPANQYMGSAENTEVFLTGYPFNATSWMDLEDIIFDYDSDEKLFSGGTEQYLVVNASKVRVYYFTELLNITITRLAEQSVKPEAPHLVDFGNYENNSGYLRFNMPVTDIYGNTLLEDKLYYQVLVDDEHNISGYTFIPAKYETIDSVMTLVPYTFIDNKYFDVLFNYETRVTDKIVYILDEEPFTKNRIGLRSVYYGGGIENASDTTWYSLRKFSDEYKFKIQEGVSYQFGDEVTSVEGIKMTFGQTLPEGQERTGQYADFTAGRSDNKVDGFDAYTIGNGANPKDDNIEGYLPDLGNLPTNGTFYIFEPEYNGALTMGIVLNVGKPFYVLEDGVPIPEFRAVYISPDYGSKYYGLVALNVQGGKKYHVFATGSKLGFYGFTYQPGETTDIISPEGTRELLFSSLVYTLPEEEILYDGEAHAATVEDGVGRGTLHIMYKDGDGNETEAAPVNPGTYTVSFDFEDGPVFSAIRFDNVGTFSIYQADLQEWEKLASAYQFMNQGEGWNRHWDFSNGIIGAKNLYGVTFTKGHVTEINLSNNNITGAFPASLLTMPQLVSLNLSNNQLTGNAGEAVDAYMKAQTDAVTTVKTIDISNNQLEGNIGLFAKSLTDLTTLDASGNCFDEVTPMIPATVTTLNLGSQTIDRTLDLNLANISGEYLLSQMPNILLYNHAQQTYSTNIRLLCATANNDWRMSLISQNGQVSLSAVSENNAYRGQSGDTLNVAVLKSDNTREGSTFRLKLSFEQGDGNFDGQINVLDLQTTINYMFEEYTTKPFNFTAANLWEDNVINVQDAVSLVNLLLEPESTSARMQNRARRSSGFSSEATASVYIENGKLIVSSAVPVASFDIVVSSSQEWTITDELTQIGFACMTRRDGNRIHLIGYSLNGTTLPVGQTMIGETGNGTVSYAMLADEDAQEISSTTNTSTTGIQSTIVDSDSKSYRLSIGANRAIMIDANGKKTMIKNEKR